MQAHAAEGVARFLWSDATDLGGYQLQMHRYFQIQKKDIVKAFEHATALARDGAYLEYDMAVAKQEQHFQSLGLDVDDEALPDLPWPVQEGAPPQRLSNAKRQETYAQLSAMMHQHISTPVALGLGHTDVGSKSAALLHVLSLECETPSSFNNSLTASWRYAQTWARRCQSNPSKEPE